MYKIDNIFRECYCVRKMVIRCFLIFALVAFACARNLRSSFEGTQGLWLTCDNQEKLDFVFQYEGIPGFDFMKVTRLPEDNVHVLVSAQEASSFKKALDDENISYKVVIDDFQKLIDEESLSQRKARMRSVDQFSKPFDFTYFPRHEEINRYLKEISESHEDISLINIGKSFESREMYGVKISSGEDKKKPAILIDAGIHAREWIAPTTALYVISQLANATNKHLYKNVDWYILPQINPDGYEYSHTDHRMWRKTRSTGSLLSRVCPGVDGNRNFGYKWMEVGASSNPCSDTYAGKKPFSEIETQNVRDFTLSKKGAIKIYLTFHCYGQYLLHPWGYTSALPENEPTLKAVAQKAEKALSAIRGTHYKIGSSTNVLYPAAGGSDDWVMAVGGADLSYTVELPGRSFVTPGSQILPVGVETFEAIKVFGEYAAKTYV